MTNKLVELTFRESLFGDKLQACPICCVDFENDDIVTPLPCDPRHYFHHKCICVWLEKRNCCPLCNEPVSLNMRQSYSASVLMSKLINKDNKQLFYMDNSL